MTESRRPCFDNQYITSIGSNLKFTVLGQSERSEGKKVDRPKRLNGNGLRKWTVCENERSRNPRVNGPIAY